MPYQINTWDGTYLVTVDEGTLNNQSTSLRLIGKNYAGYGDTQNENFVYLTENFSNTYPPPHALKGQIWYDSGNRKLKFWDASHWRTTGGAEIGPTAPVGLTTGDFWWNTDSQQLYAYDGIANYVLIGPQAVPGAGETEWKSVSLLDDQNNKHYVMEAIIDGKVEFIIAKETFNLNQTVNPIVGFSRINQGITMVNVTTRTVNGVDSGTTNDNGRYWGTASSATGFLVVNNTNNTSVFHDASEYVLSLNAVFQGTASFDNSGFTVGNSGDLAVFIDTGNSNAPTVQNLQSNKIVFKIKNGQTVEPTAQVLKRTFSPGTNLTYDLGTRADPDYGDLRWRRVYCGSVYADDFFGGTFHGSVDGSSTRADTLLFANASTTDKYRPSTNLNTGDTIVARDFNGNFAAGTVDAIATRAQYADLAERYEADAEYEPGTVVIFGGEKEITVTIQANDTRVAGVISTNPAYEMNVSPETESFLPVALRGKVPVKVIGQVRKGDVLVTSGREGHAVVSNTPAPAAAIVAKAIEDKLDDGPGVIMAVVV